MVDVIWATIAASSGFLAYLSIPMLGDLYPIDVRQRVGEFYLGLFARAYKQFAVVRRVLSGYDVLSIDVDAEQKLMEVSLEGSVIGSDKTHRFNDPDNRIARYAQKPVALAYEKVPAAIDAELAEIGHWANEKAKDTGMTDGDRADPFVEVPDSIHLVDPAEAFALVGNDVSPENIETAEELTKKRFELYGRSVGVAEMLSVFMGFAFGVGGVAALGYVRQNLLDGAGGGGVGGGIPIPPSVLDVVVIAV